MGKWYINRNSKCKNSKIKIEIIPFSFFTYNYTDMSYVPPHKRNVVNVASKPNTKKEHRELFPILRNDAGQTMIPIVPTQPIISWTGISFHVDDVITDAPNETLKDGWVNLRTYVADQETTSAQLQKCAESMETNWRRYYWERGQEIPQWIVENPYEHYEDFDQTIPYEDDYISESESSSEGEDQDPMYESDTSN